MKNWRYNYSLSDIKEIIPPVFHNRLEGWTKPRILHSKKNKLGILHSKIRIFGFRLAEWFYTIKNKLNI